MEDAILQLQPCSVRCFVATLQGYRGRQRLERALKLQGNTRIMPALPDYLQGCEQKDR
jgi:hypothetical protein